MRFTDGYNVYECDSKDDWIEWSYALFHSNND